MPLESWSDSQIRNQLDYNEGADEYEWSGNTITFAFPTSAAAMFAFDESNDPDLSELVGFSPVLDAAMQNLLRIALQLWDDLIAPNFSEITNVASLNDAFDADIEIGFTDTAIEFAHAYFPDAGSLWLSSDYNDPDDVNNLLAAPVGSYGFSTYVHELGHALGLDHPGDYSQGGPFYYQDSTVYTILSYYGPGLSGSEEVADADWTNGDGVHEVQTPQLHDIMTIQSMYGASTTTRTGATTYGFNSNITGLVSAVFDFSINENPIVTIFDSGGTDTLDLSGWTNNSQITLLSGEFSSGNGMTNNIAIAMSATIENAVGGGGNDEIVGNSSANQLTGGAGNDNIQGGTGNDTLTGGAGNDYMNGEAGTDLVVLGADYSTYTITRNQQNGAWTLVSASTGTDTVLGVESFQFTDGTRSADQLLPSDTTAPTLANVTPADGSASVATNTNFVFSFSEVVLAGTGDIIIYRGNGMAVATISVTDTSQVTFDGTTVTLNPGASLDPATAYYINIPAGAIEDAAGNDYAGITSQTALNFTTASSVITGTSGADTLEGTESAETINALAGNDTVQGKGGNDIIDGGTGIDTAVFSGVRSAYALTVGASITVDHQGGADGSDTLDGIERLQFSNINLAFDIDGNAGMVARILGAVFGPAAVQQEAWVGIGLDLADGGMSYAALTDLALDLVLGASPTNAQVVTLLYTNVIGHAPDAAALALYTGWLQAGHGTQAGLGVLAAETGENASNIGLTGFVTAGLEYL
ncbi:MAG: M10 family metallopeptidase C-terminal domain-containing protein [Burkholderiales bacterium]|nr:M10 family metallopeptidase C-terminal domain-containing protein [Burkholderiales bacterium]